MSRQSSSRRPDPKESTRPDSTGYLSPKRKNPFPNIPDEQPDMDEPGLVGGPTTESIPGTGHDDPLDPLGRKEKQIVAPLPKNDGGESALSGQPRETGGERPNNH